MKAGNHCPENQCGRFLGRHHLKATAFQELTRTRRSHLVGHLDGD
jgi:hypothetical protein